MKRVIPGEGRSLHRNSHVFSTIIIWLEHHVVKVKKNFIISLEVLILLKIYI